MAVVIVCLAVCACFWR